MTEIWYNDIGSFFNVNNLLVVFPTSNMTPVEKLNSIFRLSIYVSSFIFLLKNDHKCFYILFVVACVTYIFSVYENTEEDYIDDNIMNTEDHLEERLNKSLNKKNYTLPTKNNPFMNVLMHEYSENPKRKKAIAHTRVKDEIDSYFNEDLYRSIDDLYSNHASDRQYITMPNTEIPNDQDSFARALYYNPKKTCKEGNGIEC